MSTNRLKKLSDSRRTPEDGEGEKTPPASPRTAPTGLSGPNPDPSETAADHRRRYVHALFNSPPDPPPTDYELTRADFRRWTAAKMKGRSAEDREDAVAEVFLALARRVKSGRYAGRSAEEDEKTLLATYKYAIRRYIAEHYPSPRPAPGQTPDDAVKETAEKEAKRRVLLRTPEDEIDPEAKARYKAEERERDPKEIKSLAQLDWAGKWSSPVLTAIFLVLSQLDAGHISLAEAQYTVAAILAEAKLTPSLQRLAGDSVRYQHFVGGKTIEQIAVERRLSPREVREFTRKASRLLRVQKEGVALFNLALRKAHRERPSLI